MQPARLGLATYAPRVTIAPSNPEQAKYQKMWDHPEYREVAPGEQAAQIFLKVARLPRDAEVLDFGCGTGRGAFVMALLGGARVHMLDFADNCLDPEVRQSLTTQNSRIKFDFQDLTKSIRFHAKYGFCTDVMEHIPPADVKNVLRNILASAQHVFFQISCVDDKMGALIGEPLHLTVQPPTWWHQQLTELGAVIHWTGQSDGGEVCLVYCSAWHDASEVIPFGKINVDEAIVNAQVRTNIEAGWLHARPWNTYETREIMVLAGGPSMLEQIDEIRAKREAGMALVTVNGAYDWAITNGLSPSAQIVLDARQFNARFTRAPHPTCRYLIASQCHPDTLVDLPHDRTYLWHSGISPENEELARNTAGEYFPVPGGSTVVLRALPLLRMLGFRRMHFYGFDSCLTGDVHHAYAQAENDAEVAVPVTCGDRTFMCTPWMASQASEFRDVVKLLGDEVEMQVHGDGLIAHIIKTGYDMSVKAAAETAATA